MVAYCKEEHMKIDYLNHKSLCMAIQLIAKRRGDLHTLILKICKFVCNYNQIYQEVMSTICQNISQMWNSEISDFIQYIYVNNF